jgi:hypothetical protein
MGALEGPDNGQLNAASDDARRDDVAGEPRRVEHVVLPHEALPVSFDCLATDFRGLLPLGRRQQIHFQEKQAGIIKRSRAAGTIGDEPEPLPRELAQLNSELHRRAIHHRIRALLPSAQRGT